MSNSTIEGIWRAAAASLGFTIKRADSAYASSDGQGTIEIGLEETLDPDDSVAQLIFHELCHGLCEGPEKWSLPDWGLCNFTNRDLVREYASLRIQIYLCRAHGLRTAMAPTTIYRQYHDAIGDDPLQPENDPAALIAKAALNRGESQHWNRIIEDALALTVQALAVPQS